MNEIALSNNLSQIELEIQHHKQIAGQSIWEIGRRLKHVKESDLTHGQFRQWHESLGIDKDFAYKSMKIAEEFKNAVIFIENWRLSDQELKDEIFAANHQMSLFEA